MAEFVEPWNLENDFEFPDGEYDYIRIHPAVHERDEHDNLVKAVGDILFDDMLVKEATIFSIARTDGSVTNRLRYVRAPGAGTVLISFQLPDDYVEPVEPVDPMAPIDPIDTLITLDDKSTGATAMTIVDLDDDEKPIKKSRTVRKKHRGVGELQTVAVAFSSQNPLNSYQEDIVAECLSKGSGAISVPMGNGKTLTFLVLGQMQSQKLPFIVVCSKTLTVSWELEIDKFFQHRLPYVIFHGDKAQRDSWVLEPHVRLVIATPDLLAKAYQTYNVEERYSMNEVMLGAIANRIFRRTTDPWLANMARGPGVFFSQRWGCMAVDEAQDHTNSNTTKCRSIGALCCQHRWLLSGTMFNEPRVERILGFSLLLNLERPRSLPGTADLIRGQTWGIKPFMVERGHNPAIKMPKYTERVVAHALAPEEATVYQSLRLVMREIKNHADRMRAEGDTANARRFSQYKLALVTYLRQALMCPIVPIASVCVDMADYKGKSHLSRVMMRELQNHNLDGWLNNEESVKSSRIRAIVAELEKFKNDKVVVFGAFRSCLTVLMRYIDPTVYQIFTLTANMSRHQRAGVLENFKNAKSGVLVMSYSLGAVGLNLQCANTVFLTDMMWNFGTTSQAIARVFRAWQINDVQVIFFTSNTGIEQAILEKQLAKLKVITELYHGSIRTKVPKLKMDDILRIIDQDDTVGMVDSVRGFRSTDHMKTELEDMMKNRSVAEIEASEQAQAKMERSKARALAAVQQKSMQFEQMDLDSDSDDTNDIAARQKRDAEIMAEEQAACQRVAPASRKNPWATIMD